MYIRSIELKNFQKHASFKASFTNSVNVLYGESDAGKSCVIRAMRWILVGDIHGDVIRKEGTKKTSVTVVLNNDVEVTRVKSDSVNRYEVNDGKGVIKYDSVGRKLPEPIANLFNIPVLEIDKEKVVLNIHSQLDAPFLLSQSGGFRVKVLNKLTGNHILDKVAQSLNKDILSLNKQSRSLKEELETKDVQRKNITQEKEQKEKLYLELSEREESLKEIQKRLCQGRDLLVKLTKVEEELKGMVNNDINYLEISKINNKDLQAEINKLEKAVALNKKIDVIENDLENLEIESTDIDIPTIDIKSMYKHAEQLKIVARIAQELQTLEKRSITLSKSKEDNKALICEKIAKYKELLKEYGKCPTCHTKIDDDVLKGIDL